MALKHLLAGVAAIALMGGPALAQNQDTTQQQQPAQAGEQQQLAQEDMEFATEAAQGGLKEVQLGELAQQQAASDAVKEFGQRMVTDHGKANDQLKQIAQQKGIELPQELPTDAQQLHDELAQKSGEEFDRAYMDEMVKDHEEDVEKFRQYTENGQDPDLTGFAEETLPVLEEHLQLAQKTQEQVTASAGGMEQPDAAIATAPQGATQGEQTAAPAQPATTQTEQAVTEQPEQPAAPQTEEQAATQQPEQPAATETEEPAVAPEQQQAATQPGQVVSIEEVLGASVVNAEGDEVAEIEDVVLGEGDQYYAILSVGGFLGIGDKKVAVPLDQLQLGEDEAYLMSGETEEQLEQMPEYDEEQYRPLQRQG
jgi:putative membrane protein